LQCRFIKRGDITLWDAKTGIAGPVINSPGLLEMAWDPLGGRLASARYGDPSVQLWDSVTGHEINTPLTGDNQLGGSDKKLDWSPDGHRIAYAGGVIDNHLFVNNVTDGRLEQEWMLSEVYRTRDLAWAPDSRQLAWSCLDNTLRIWDADTARLRTLAIFFPGGSAAAFNAAGELLYCDAEAEQQLVYLVGDAGGSTEMLTPAEFLRRVGAVMPPPN
jgi:WD40 repeat protein